MTIHRTIVTSRAALEAFLAQYTGRHCCLPLVVCSADGQMARVTVWVKESNDSTPSL